jgi:hypothetical protein
MQAYTPTGRWARTAGLTLMLLLGRNALAEETLSRLSQSVEGPASEASLQSEQLVQAPMDEATPLVTDGGRTAAQRLLAHPTGRTFAVYDAQTTISRDDDDDGFYHRLRVGFDPDVTSGGSAWVYARLYLSLEGGPWNHYFTTDVFPIDGENTSDAYEVVTNLVDGYPTGYYDVLIELYDADYDLLVDSYGPYEDRDLAVLPLEDSYRDNDGGGGAMGPGLALLALLALTPGLRNGRRGRAIRS